MLKGPNGALKVLLIAIGVFALGSLSGAWLERRNQEKLTAAASIGVANQYITALLHLEKNELERARQMLLLGVEVEVTKLAKINHELIDGADLELEGRSLKYYAAMRKNITRLAGVGMESANKEIYEYVERHKK